MTASTGPALPLTRRVVYWAATECTKQRSGEMSVAWMLDGWAYTISRMRTAPTMRDVVTLGRAIEPKKNANGIRTRDVEVNGNLMTSPGHVEKHLRLLVSQWARLSSKEWFKAYEEIHPFIDGNGRTGSVLFNWHRGTLLQPIAPPNFWPPEPLDTYDSPWRPLRPPLRKPPPKEDES